MYRLFEQESRRLLWVWVFGIFLSAVAGCNSKTHPELRSVSGQILFQGEPVEAAVVAFYHEDSLRPATGVTDADGNFHLTSFEENDGALPGVQTVVVTKIGIDETPPVQSMDEAMEVRKAPKSRNALPEKYSSVKTTPLRVTVDSDAQNNHIIELE